MSTPTQLAGVFGLGLLMMVSFLGILGFGIGCAFNQWFAVPASLCLLLFTLSLYRLFEVA